MIKIILDMPYYQTENKIMKVHERAVFTACGSE